MKKSKILIVEASAPMRQLLEAHLSCLEDMDIAGIVVDANEAIANIPLLNPDLMLISTQLPHAEVLALVEHSVAYERIPMVLLSALLREHADTVVHALAMGAYDVIARPDMVHDSAKMADVRNALVAVMRAAAQASMVPAASGEKRQRILHFKAKREGLPVIAIGAGAGGVEALNLLTANMPTIAPPMVITQHLPEVFMHALAQRLDRDSLLTIVEATHGARLHNGYAFIAPGNTYLTIKKIDDHFVCQLSTPPKGSVVSNPIDTMMHSVAEQAGRNAIGVIMTGAGEDGAAGLLAMRESGAYTLAQDEASSMSYAMAAAAVARGAVAKQLPLDEIAKHVLDASNQRMV